ncbi:filamin A-interacting protein 1-like [Leptopilina boulardi]|uniref:filamin A-interacting protein 1-like n=1 Tax=Leptopilina boulardi TaxID=63433 RepID=UPI0021F60170|nr:filamin A-interacting protein 1-like [Leptopilina boulardi]
MWNIIYPMIKFDEIFTSKFHDSLIMNKLVGASLKFNQRKINNSPVDNEEKVVDFENFLPIEDSLIIEPVLNLKEFDSNLQESILNLKESEQKPVLNSEEPILNLEERVLNHQKSDSNLQNALNVEEKPIKIAKLESVTKAPNYIDGKKGKFMMNKSLSRIPIALSNVSKGLKKTREKNKIQAQKKDLKIKKEIDQVSNINCRKEKNVRSLSAERTSFSCQELKGISGNKNKMERRSKIPVRKKKIENMNMEKKDYIGDKKTNRITNVNLNPKVVENFNTEQEFKQEKEEEKSILESENIKIKNTKQIVETKFNYNEINNTETMKIKENEEKKLENDKFSLKSEIQKNVKVKNNEIEKTNLKMEKKTKRKNPKFLDVDYKNLDEEKRNDEEIKDQLSETLLLKRTNCSTLIDRNSFSLTTQILKRSNKTIKETNPPTKIVFISKISQESMPKIQLENQGNVEKQESQTSTIQELFEENFISKHKETKNHERREETSKTEFSKHNHSMINIKDIKAIIDSLLKSKIYQKKFIIVEGKKKLMKFADKKRKKKLSRKELNSEIKIIPQAKILKAENGNFKKSTNESMNTDWISRKESHFENKNGAYWISQACSSSRQSNGGKEEKQLSNKVHSKEMKKKIKLNKIENCIGKSSIVNSVRGEEFIRGIQQSSSESSKRVSDCKAHSEDFDSRKCTQMSRDSGILFEKWTDEIEKIEAWNIRVKHYLSQIRMKLLLAEEKAEEECSVKMFQKINYSLGDRKELTLRNTVEYGDSKRNNISKDYVNVDLQTICRDMKRVTNIINNHTSSRYLNRHSFEDYY